MEDGLLADDAVTGTFARPDNLGRATFAEHACQLLDRVRLQSESSVLALVGPWGSGKTSVLLMLERFLKQRREPSWLIAKFTPWDYSDLHSMQSGFFSELRNVMPQDRQWNLKRERLAELSSAVSPFASAMQIYGVSVDPAAAAKHIIDRGLTASATRKKAEDSLRDNGQPVLFILDDLDRLEAEELLLVLKLVRNLGRLPNIYYLLSYDEETVASVLGQSAVAAGSPTRAYDFLEKLVQVRLDLPALRPYQRSTLLNAALDQLFARHSVQLSQPELERMRDAWRDHIDVRLTTPRKIRRVVGQVDAVWSLVSDEVDFVDFFIVTWLRVEEPNAYAMVQRYRREILGESPDLFFWPNPSASAKARKDKLPQQWRERMAEYGVAENRVESVLALLATLFPSLASQLANTSQLSGAGEGRPWGRVSNPYYFDRFFNYGVPDEDLSDRLVRRTVSALRTGNRNAADLEAVKQVLVADTGRAVSKLDEALIANDAASPQILEFLADAHRTTDGNFNSFVSPSTHMAHFARRIILRMEKQSALSTVADLSQQLKGLDLLAEAFYGLRNKRPEADRAETPATDDWLPDALEKISRELKSVFDRLKIHGQPSEFTQDMVDRWYVWRTYDKDAAMAWLSQVYAVENWDLLRLLTSLVPRVWIMGVESAARLAIDSYPTGLAITAFGAENIRALVAALPTARQEHDPEERPEDTHDNRRKLVATVFRALESWDLEAENTEGPQNHTDPEPSI